jgi:UDP-glucose 4-epimerase
VRYSDKRALVTGASGFIGSHLVEDLLINGWKVTGIDNFSTGKRQFLDSALRNDDFKLIECDLLKEMNLSDLFLNIDRVYHLSANADVRGGPSNPSRDFQQNTFVTHKVLEASRIAKVNEFALASTGSIYGETNQIPTPEDAPFPIQTSLYGASKLACEGLTQAYSESFGIKSWIFRFVSILGPRYTHGHVFDFYRQLKRHPEYLEVLGNGRQKKSYLHVSDCVSAIRIAMEKDEGLTQVYNLGTDEFCEVLDSIKWITNEMGAIPKLILGSSSKGWIGDSPFIYLDNSKIRRLGWKPQFTIEQSVIETVRYLTANSWLMN